MKDKLNKLILAVCHSNQRQLSCQLTFISLLVILAYLSPTLLLGEHSRVTIHDQLDGAFVRLKVLAESGKIFAPPTAIIDNVMNGAPRASFGTELNLTLWLFYFLGPFAAYVVNQILVRLVAFIGMYLLLRRHFLENEKHPLVAFGTALTFALLPYYSLFGLSVAGQPLVLYAFLNIRQHRADWNDWLIITLVPLYSIFALSYAFFLCAMVVLWLHELLHHGRVNRNFGSAIALMLGVFALVEYRALLAVLSPSMGFTSHRVEFNLKTLLPHFALSDAIQSATWNLVFGQNHAASSHSIVILPIVLIAVGLSFLRKIRIPLFLEIFLLVALISYWYGFWLFLAIEAAGALKSLPYLNLSRFHYLHPLLWYVLFGLALQSLSSHVRFGRILVIAALIAQTFYLFSRNEHFVGLRLGSPTYAEFYSTQLYSDIYQFIGQPKDTYHVVSIGMHPSVAQYNGFHTLDGLFYNYPLAYKHQFRKLIARELEQNRSYKNYYDAWGSRFYIFVSELSRTESFYNMLTKDRVRNQNIHIERLAFNTPVFKEMGGKYIFSALEVRNSVEIGLQLLKVFSRDDSPWEIYVYQAI